MYESLHWETKSFQELSTNELYDILHLRSAVFVIEQDCIYQDMDYYDQKALHLFVYIDDKLAAYTRIFAPKVKFKEASIGRVIISQQHRRTGLGKLLMEQSIKFCNINFPNQSIKISAQCYLERFYQSLGFKIVSEIYLEDGIEHQEMKYEI